MVEGCARIRRKPGGLSGVKTRCGHSRDVKHSMAALSRKVYRRKRREGCFEAAFCRPWGAVKARRIALVNS